MNKRSAVSRFVSLFLVLGFTLNFSGVPQNHFPLSSLLAPVTHLPEPASIWTDLEAPVASETAPALSPELELVEEQIVIRRHEGKSVTTARLVRTRFDKDPENDRRLREFMDRFRGDNWFDIFLKRNMEAHYILDGNDLLEFRVVTSDVKGILEGEPLFEHPERRFSVNSSVRVKRWRLTPERARRFEQILSGRGRGLPNGSGATVLKKSESVMRESLPLPLRKAHIDEARNLGDGIRAYLSKEERIIYLHDAKSGLALTLKKDKGRVVSAPLFIVSDRASRLRYAELLYNALAKLHNATGRTPKVWDGVLMDLKNGVGQGELEPADLPGLVQLLHKARKTVPPAPEKLEYLTSPLETPRKAVVVYDGGSPLTLPLMARLQETPNIAPEIIVGRDPKKGIAPFALWRNLNHGDYEKLYPDSSWEEWEETWEETAGDKKAVVKSGFFGFIMLNGKKIWVFKNFEQMKLLKKAGKLPAEVAKMKIDLMIGPKLQIDVRPEQGRGKEELKNDDEMALREILGQEEPIRTYSQVALFENPGPYRMVVDPLWNAGKVNSGDLHFKAPHTTARLLARLVQAFRRQQGMKLNNIRSLRLDSQLDYAPPLDKSEEKGLLNASVPFDEVQDTQLKKQFQSYFSDMDLAEGGSPSIDTVEGKQISDKTSSLFDVTLEVASDRDLTKEDILRFLSQLSENELAGYLHVYSHSIMGQHVRKMPGVHISSASGIKVVRIKEGQNTYKVKLKFWFDRDWEEAGELIRLADSVGFPDKMEKEMPAGTALEAQRDLVRDFLFTRGTIPPARRIFPYVEFAPEPAAGILEAPTGRIGRVFLYALGYNLPQVQSDVFIPEFQVGQFNTRLVGVVGPARIEDAVIPITADGTFGRWNADVQFGPMTMNDPRRRAIDYENILGWMTINGSERIYLLRGRERGSNRYLPRNKIPYGAVVPLAELTPTQADGFFLFAASGDKPDEAGVVLKNTDASGVARVKKVLIPQPWKKIEKGDGKITFVYRASDVREIWKSGNTFSPGSCTTNCAVFPHMINELLFNLRGIVAGGTKKLNKRIQRAVSQRFESCWDDFPAAWRENPEEPVSFELFPGQSETTHAETNSQSARNAETRALREDEKKADAKSLDVHGMNDTESGVTKALKEILPKVTGIETRSNRVITHTGSKYEIFQNAAMENVKPQLTMGEILLLGYLNKAALKEHLGKEDAKKYLADGQLKEGLSEEDKITVGNKVYHAALQKYLKKKVLDAFDYAARYLFQGSLRVSKEYEIQNAHATRRDPATSIFEEAQFRLEVHATKREIRFAIKEVLWYDNEWGFTVQVLGLLSELALAMGEEAAENSSSASIVWDLESVSIQEILRRFRAARNENSAVEESI